MVEAARQFQQALDQLLLLPDNPERHRKELEIWSSLGAALLAVKGYAAAETGHAYGRALELWEQLGSPSEFFHIPYGRARYHAHRGDFDLALGLDEDLLRLCRQRDDSAGLVLGHYSSGRNLMLSGRFSASLTHLKVVLALYDPISHGSLIHQVGEAPHVNSHALSAIVLFCLGYPDQASVRSRAAIAEARKSAYLPSLASSLSNGAVVLWLVGDTVVLEEWMDELVAIAIEQGFPYWRAHGMIYRAWVKVKDGDVAEGLSLLRTGSVDYGATGAAPGMDNIALVSEGYEIAGQTEEAICLLDGALQIVERTGERWFAAELNRRKGQLLLQQGHSEAAEELFCKALSIAREQEAKPWELRAAASLARLWRDQGRRTEARDLLALVYGWFTEGFGTPDLKDAKALLDELKSA